MNVLVSKPLLEVLELHDVCFRLDALHTPKKRWADH
jgi:hypothetical protein